MSFSAFSPRLTDDVNLPKIVDDAWRFD